MSMIKLLWRFALLVAAAIGFAWLADKPGHVTIQWLGRDIEMSVLVAAVIVLVAIMAVLFVWRLVQRIWRSPATARDYLRFRKQRKAYESLSRGIIAAGAGDAHTALRHAKIAGETLLNEPLVTLLSAQAAQLKGDRAAVKQAFADMAKSPDTELLGLRGLFAEAKQAGDWAEARNIAERALAKNNRLPWASTAILQVQITAKDWAAAAATLSNQAKAGLLPRAEATKKQAAFLAAQALIEEDKNKPKALELALEAHGLDGSLVPAAAVAARCFIATDNSRKALKILRSTWSKTPHPELVHIFSNTKPDETPENRFERVRDFVGDAATHIEHARALARAAIDAKRFDVARETLQSFIEDRPQARICGLMAEIEDAQGDKQKSREWLAKALHAARDPIWVSDGVASPKWTPVSPVTGDIVACEWKPPFELGSGEHWLQAPAQMPQLATKAETAQPQPRAPIADDPGID
jgi:HemY protein